jgi:RNA polymerase sigma factor (sigma-70 family)
VSLAVVAANEPAMVVRPPELETLDAVWRVRQAIDRLPPELAVVVRMQHLDGLSHAEIAEALRLPGGTVKSRSHRAHRRLARLLGHLRTV